MTTVVGRLIVVTGKGGVGKTTVAASVAAHAASTGLRVLVASTDAAHSLGDVLGVELAGTPRRIADRLDAVEISSFHRLNHEWSSLQSWMTTALRWAGVSALEADEVAMVPGLDEALVLVEIADLARRPDYDLIVVDCSPTAEAVRLLSLPDAVGWWSRAGVGTAAQLIDLVRPLAERLGGAPMPSASTLDEVTHLGDRLAEVRSLLADRARTSMWVVTTAESVVCAETRRALAYLHLFGLATDAVIANRLVSDAAADGWYATAAQRQQRVLAELERDVEPIPVVRVSLQPDEPIGVEKLAVLGHEFLAGRSVTEPWATEPTWTASSRIDDEGVSQPVMSVWLGRWAKGRVGLARKASDLHVTVGSQRRAIRLPDSWAMHEVAGAAVVDGRLEIRFRHVTALISQGHGR